jgi:hypothetical protein
MKRSMSFLAVMLLCVGPLTATPQGRPTSPGRPSSPPSAPSSPGRPSMPDRPSPSTPGKSGSMPGSEKGATGGERGKTMSDLLTQNTKLSSRLQTLTGKDAQTACDGFKNLGLCIAAAHVANNVSGISFDDLKSRMTGTDAKSLGDAIHDLNANVDAKGEAKKAKKQADVDLRESGS